MLDAYKEVDLFTHKMLFPHEQHLVLFITTNINNYQYHLYAVLFFIRICVKRSSLHLYFLCVLFQKECQWLNESFQIINDLAVYDI